MQALKQRLLERTPATPPPRRLADIANKENVDTSTGIAPSKPSRRRVDDSETADMLPLEVTNGRDSNSPDDRRSRTSAAEPAAIGSFTQPSEGSDGELDKAPGTPRSRRSSGRTAAAKTPIDQFVRPADRPERRSRSKSSSSRSK